MCLAASLTILKTLYLGRNVSVDFICAVQGPVRTVFTKQGHNEARIGKDRFPVIFCAIYESKSPKKDKRSICNHHHT